jgi:3-deoxy-D-manno-octulosonic-acid transferase
MFEAIFFLIYRFVFWPMALLVLPVLSFFIPKVRDGLALRRQKPARPTWPKKPIWIHAASGEFEYAKPIIRELKKKDPYTPIVVTYYSPSYAKAIASFPGVDYSQPLPLDLPGPVHSFLKWLNPEALLIARTDLWPELLRQTAERKIPSLLFSATIRPFEGVRYFARPYARMVFSYISAIFAVSDKDLHALNQLGETRAQVRGDTRFDQVLFRLQNPKEIKIARRPNRPLILVAGSTWPEDENVLFAAALPLLKENLLSLIVVPHEPHAAHVDAIKKFFIDHELSCSLYSEISEWQTSVLIVDVMGVLAEMYAAGDIAFVGGSFRAKVHSVMEPLGAGLQTLVGPHYMNNREAIEFHNADDPDSAVVVVKDRSQMERALRRFTQNIGDLQENHARIRNDVQKRAGATEHVLRWLEIISRL